MNTTKLLKYIDVAKAVAALSKDRSTKVGALAIGPSHDIRAVGYNGMPRGVDDDVDVRHERPEKYFWIEHAERNLIYNAARNGVSLEGCILVVTPLFPCMDCARAIVQAGFVGVFAQAAPSERWAEHFERSAQLFKEVNMDVQLYADD